MNAFLEQLSKIGPARLVLMFGVSFGVAAALMAITLRAGEADKALLFAGLEYSEVGAITERLDKAGVAYELVAGGSTIMVAKGEVLSARLMLSSEGLPRAGSVGYEIFDTQPAFGATQFQQQLNRVRALEGELARTIRELDAVSGARVHLALPERRLFDRAASEPKASVWLDLRQSELGAHHARAVRNLVAGAVPGLKASNVTILDADGRLLASGAEGEDELASSAAMDDRQSAIEARIRAQIVDLVESVVGVGRVRAQVSATVDFNRITESAETFDPEGQVVRSTETREESNSESDREGDGTVSASTNVPGLDDAEAEDARRSEAASNATTEVVNYEISRRTRTEVREVGAISRLSIAVAVDGVTSRAEDGTLTYAPRSAEDMARIDALVRSAVGFNQERGDVIEVANVQFALLPPDGIGVTAPSPFTFDKNDIMRGAELLVLLIVAILIIFLVARPLTKSATTYGVPGAMIPGVAGVGGVAALPGATAVALPGTAAGAVGLGHDDDDTIDVARIDGQVKASSIKKVAEIARSHPEESVAILRNWLHES